MGKYSLQDRRVIGPAGDGWIIVINTCITLEKEPTKTGVKKGQIPDPVDSSVWRCNIAEQTTEAELFPVFKAILDVKSKKCFVFAAPGESYDLHCKAAKELLSSTGIFKQVNATMVFVEDKELTL